MPNLPPVVLLVAVAAVAIAPSTSAQADATATRPPLVLPPGDLDVRALVERAGAYLGRQYDVEKVDGKIPASSTVLRLQNPLTLQGATCEALVSRIAYARGLALVPGGQVHRWIWRRGPNRAAITATPVELSAAEVSSPAAPQICVVTSVRIPGCVPSLPDATEP